MKIQDLIFDIIVEDIKNKTLFEFLLKKWYGENGPTNQQKIEGEELYKKFVELRNRLSPNLPDVATFLNRFDGGNFEKFEPNNLKDITKYSYEQIKFLIGEFFDLNVNLNDEETDPIFNGRDLPPTDERVEASKNLWYSKGKNLIVDEEGFRVYLIPDQKTSINFGYYQNHVTNRPPYTEQSKSHMTWCTTRYNVNNNLWSSYRNRRTFYFIIDESKNPEIEPNVQINQYYLSALQYATDAGSENFRLTSILNDGSDPIFSEENLYSIYPKLRGNLEKIVKIPFDPVSEVGENTDIVNMMNEIEGNRYEFAVMEKRHKKAYIDRGKPLTKGKSWESMDESLRATYIDLTTRHNVNERFTFSIIDKIKEKSANVTSLNRRLEIIGLGGIGYIAELLMKDFVVYRTSLDNSKISIFRTKSSSDKKFGIYDGSKIDWLQSKGINYGPYYTLNDDIDLYFDDQGESYIIEKFEINGQEDNKSFYCIFPNKENNKLAGGHFLSHGNWLLLKEKLSPHNDDMSKFDTSSDTDIKEIKKGV